MKITSALRITVWVCLFCAITEWRLTGYSDEVFTGYISGVLIGSVFCRTRPTLQKNIK